MNIPVLYQDNHLLVVEKPVNMPVQADVSGDPDLLSTLKAYIKETCGKPGEVYLGLVHRLDRPVGGVMVFARTSKAAARLTAQFKSREAKKRYAAVVSGNPPASGTLTDWILKDERTHSASVVPEGTPDAKNARLSYRVLGRRSDAALVDVSLDTGRPHQIRVQMLHAGYPLLGDQRYNPDACPGAQIALWAYALTLRHPTLGESMTFFSAPQGSAFSAFPAETALLPAFSVCRGVYLDDSILVVDKNAGAETEGALAAEVSELFPGARPVHRLDANTEGLVLLARDEATAARLEALFYRHDLEKIYHAVVKGVPEPSGRLVHYAQKDADAATVHLVSKDAPGALRMALSYRRLATDGVKSLLEISLETGRTHQIRVQMAAIGCPVLGDDKYGDRAFNKEFHAKTQQLLAKKLTVEGRTFESCRELTL